MSILTGFGLAVEIGDWQRFTGSSIGAYSGWRPPSPPPVRNASRARSPRPGNTHARRLLVGAALHHRNAYRPGLTMRARWDQGPAAARARGHEGNHRLHHRWEVCIARKKWPVVANVAIARGARRLVLVAGRHGRRPASVMKALSDKAQTVTGRTPTSPTANRSRPRDDPGTTGCPACRRSFTPIGREVFCKQRLPQDGVPAPAPAAGAGVMGPASRSSREFTVYECPRLR